MQQAEEGLTTTVGGTDKDAQGGTLTDNTQREKINATITAELANSRKKVCLYFL